MVDNQEKLNSTIIKTLVFFDLFAYPLTAYELWRYLPLSISFQELREVLQFLSVEKKISETHGFYYLPGRAKILDKRQQRYHFANRKIKIAHRAIKLFKFLPWVKFVALSNLIGRHNLRDGSDIDLFIIAGRGRLWLTRLFCAGIMKVLGKRPTKKNKRDKICLSFYVDSNHLDLSSTALEGGQDWYFYYWLAGLYSLYDEGGYHFRLIKNNQWLKEYLPNIDFLLSNQAYTPSLQFRPRAPLASKAVGRFLDKSESLSEYWQRKIMPKELMEIANVDSRVLIKEGLLKLYLIDRRQEFQRRYKERLVNFEINDY